MLFAANFLSFWSISGIFFLLDIVCFQQCGHRRIIPCTRAQLVKLYQDSWPVVLRNQLASVIYLCVYEYLFGFVAPEVENKNWIYYVFLAIKFGTAFFVVSFLLTTFHLLYHKYANGKYYWIHKLHHEHRAPVGISAFYSLLLEHIITLTHGSLTLAALRLTHAETCLALAMFNLGIVCGHSGYRFLPIARYHNVHHQKIDLHFADSSWMEDLFEILSAQELRPHNPFHLGAVSHNPS